MREFLLRFGSMAIVLTFLAAFFFGLVWGFGVVLNQYGYVWAMLYLVSSGIVSISALYAITGGEEE